MSVGQQPLESKITVIQDALDAGHGTIAITVADIAIASHPNDARLLTLRARIKGKLFNDQEGAMADLASAMQLKPHCTWSKLSYAQNKFTQGQKLGALTAMYDISETIHQDNFVVDDKLLRNIITFLDFLLHHFPEDSRILQQRGYCKAATKDIQQSSEAVQDLSAAIELGLDTAWSFHYRAKAFLVLQKWQEAVTDLERAHLLEPQESSILTDRIAAKRKLHDHAGGIADYNLLEKMRGLDAEQLLRRGNLRQAVNDDEGSKADHRKASLTGLTTMTNLLARANAKFALGDLAGALQDLNHADKVQPGQLAVLKQRGMVKFMLQDLEGFVKDLNGRTDDAYWVWHLAAAKLKLKADQS